MSVLTKNEIRKLIEEKSMIKDYVDLEKQLQPNGFDLTLNHILIPGSCGFIWVDSKNIPNYKNIEVYENSEGEVCYALKFGMYIFNINETVSLPSDICAITIQRSSIMRCGVNTNIGFWDSGYIGKGYSTLNVMNVNGFNIQPNSSIIQMIFLKNSGITELYNGSWKGEGIKI